MKNVFKPIVIISIIMMIIIFSIGFLTWAEYKNEQYKKQAAHTIDRNGYNVIAIYKENGNKVAPSTDPCIYNHIQYLSLKNNKILIVENIVDADIAICV